MKRVTSRAALIAGVLLAASFADAQEARGPFDARTLPVHGRRIDTVLGDFSGDGVVDILNTSIHFDAEPPTRWLALHIQDKARGFLPTPDFLWPIHATAAALTFGNFLPSGGVEICTIAPDGVYYYPFEKGRLVEEPRKLVHARTFFASPSPRALPVWMFPQDISGNGLDDLLLPVAEGYRAYFQTEPGRFGKVSRLEAPAGSGPSVAPARFPESLEYVASLFSVQVRLPRFALADIDGDGRKDLATIQGNVVTYFFQREPEEFRMQRPWSARYMVSTLEENLRRDTINYMQVGFHDIDGDTLPDLVVSKTEGELGLFESLKTSIYVHFGATGRGNYDPNVFIAVHGVSIDPQFLDMNGDGKLDCLTSRLRTDLVNQALTMGILGDVSVEYEVFQFDGETQSYLESPVYSYPVRITFEDIEKKGAASRPLLYVTGDITGDGRPDQVRFDPRTDTLEVHPGRDRFAGGGKARIDFDPTAHIAHKLERHPRFVQFHDLNADGRMDILLHYAGQLGVLTTRGR